MFLGKSHLQLPQVLGPLRAFLVIRHTEPLPKCTLNVGASTAVALFPCSCGDGDKFCGLSAWLESTQQLLH
jgi:hypothetical protein